MRTKKRASKSSFKIRNSTNEDLAAIKVWLSAESISGQTHSFIDNWDTIEKYHHSGAVLVCMEPTTNQPIAFQANASVNPEILAVRNEWQRKGIGALLVKHYLTKILPSDQPIVVVQCCPTTSIPFWKRMGFKVWTAKNNLIYGRLSIEPTRCLPKDRPVTNVKIIASASNYSSDRYETTVRRKASVSRNGSLQLEKQVALFDPRYPNDSIPFLKVFVGRKLIFNDKANTPQATKLGVQRCDNGIFLRKLYPQKIAPLKPA